MGILRLLLAITVVIGHSKLLFGYNFADPIVAVQLFYIISGFYMSLILTDKYKDYKLFITNRALKIYPIYWATIILTLAVTFLFYILFKDKLVPTIWAQAQSELDLVSIIFLLIVNITVVGQDLVLFLGLNSRGGLYLTPDIANAGPPVYRFLLAPQAWTLSLELVFYALAPFLVRLRTRFLLLIILSSILLRLTIYSQGLNHDPWTYRFFPTELALFLLGIIAHRVYLKLQPSSRDFRNLFVFLALVGIIGVYNYVPISDDIKRAALYALMTMSIPYIYTYFKDIRWDRKLGELSYPIYITHMLVIFVFGSSMLSWIKNSELYGFVIVGITLILALLMNKLIQQRIEAHRVKRVERHSLIMT